ncbi:MAG: hypothetical protein JRF59_01480 [Deltaproteobacteria bacterium]|nr:hypothetical protein [Deltaproteobacteria bacterium]MBW1949527.1 hypothetical protein [Deltaproteobacteria bacterium]MBW2008422.1 hypothetical protein [Deltaproteobacteria bacterium]MBW2102184.1 hypothetical protein [Deltaproteobacteria bacterium]MBW2346498.1 hypothetical protein [Deltaproteobacteria bacterium]
MAADLRTILGCEENALRAPQVRFRVQQRPVETFPATYYPFEQQVTACKGSPRTAEIREPIYERIRIWLL